MFAGKSVSRERRGPFPGCPGLVGVGETRLAVVAERRTIHRIGFPGDVQLARSSSKLSRVAVDYGFVRDHREQGLRNRLRCGNRRIKENVVARVGNPVMLDMERGRCQITKPFAALTGLRIQPRKRDHPRNKRKREPPRGRI